MKQWIILALTLLVTAFLLAACQTPGGGKDETGSCGENLTWTYHAKTKTLEITGSGEMKVDPFYWREYEIETLNLPEGMTSISYAAFYGHPELVNLSALPSTLVTIEDSVFYSCGIQGALVIPDQVETIGNYAFTNCKGITSLTLGKSVKSIGEEAFGRLENVSGELILPEGLITIGRVAFDRSPFTGALVIPDTVTTIGDYAFAQTKFNSLKLSSSLTEIEECLFCYCEEMKGDLVIPEGVTTIGRQAFSGCTFDGSLTLPSTLESIDEYAFSYASGLTGALVIPDGIHRIQNNVFENCKSFTSLTLPKQVDYISYNAFAFCSGLSNELILPEGLKIIGDNAFTGCENLKGALVIPDGVVSVGDAAFYGCESLTHVSFPETLLNIKKDAFTSCIGISELNFPASLVSIGSEAFYGCDHLEKVSFGENIKSIGAGAFSNCPALKKAELQEGNTDYFASNEENPSFDASCTVNVSPAKLDIKLNGAKNTANGDESSSGDEEVPYYWTDGITGFEFVGTKNFADVSVLLDSTTMHVFVNGREVGLVGYQADANSDDTTVYTDGFTVRNVEFKNFTLLGYRSEAFKVDIVDADGNEDFIYFVDGSEEQGYIAEEEAEMLAND